MKKRILTICLLIAAVILASCAENAQTPISVSPADYISGNGITGWQAAANAWMIGIDDASVNKPQGLGSAESVLFNAFAGLAIDETAVAAIKTTVEQSPETLTTAELTMYAYALKAAGVEYDNTSAVAELVSRQQNDGGFGLGHDYAVSEPTPSSYALDLVMLWRDKVSDNCYDGILVYFYNNMTDNNAWEDEDGKESCSLTCRVLMGFIHAGIRYDGEDAQAILTSINTLFGIRPRDNTVTGYKEYADDTAISQEATGYAYLANTVSAIGDLWSVFDIRGGVN